MKIWNISNTQYAQLKKGYKVFDNEDIVYTTTLLQSVETGKKMGIATFKAIFYNDYTYKVIDNFNIKGNVINLVNKEKERNYIYLWEVVEINIFDNFKEVPLQIGVSNE